MTGYPRVSSALAASNLTFALANAMRAVLLMIGIALDDDCDCGVSRGLHPNPNSRLLALLCGFSLLAEIPIWVWLMGWFIGNEMFLVSGALITLGGFLLPRA